MGVYRVNSANGAFPFGRGAVFEAADGPSVRAGVRSGVLSRVDWEPAPVKEAPGQQERPEGDAGSLKVDGQGEGDQLDTETAPDPEPKKGKRG